MTTLQWKHAIVRHLPRLTAATLLITAGCIADAAPVRVDSGVTFAAHETHAGLVIDRDTRGGTGLAQPRGGFFEPVYLVRTQDGDDERLRIESPGRVVVEGRTTASASPEVGRVEPSWENNAIRLTLRPPDGPPIQTGLFRRTDNGAGGSVFTRLDQDRIDLEGSYQAALRTPDGTTVGWFGFVVGKAQPGHVMYEGVLPPAVDTALAVAAAEALGSEIGFIESTTHGVSRAPEER